MGTFRLERLCGRQMDEQMQQLMPPAPQHTWFHKARMLMSHNTQLEASTCHYFEYTGNQFMAAAVVAEIVHTPRYEYDDNGLRQPMEFSHLMPLNFEFVGDERAYRNSLNMALFQLL
jgi:hypothetical protein